MENTIDCKRCEEINRNQFKQLEYDYEIRLKKAKESASCELMKRVGSDLYGIKELALRLTDEKEQNRLLHYIERIEDRLEIKVDNYRSYLYY